jgi:hypothetical protein
MAIQIKYVETPPREHYNWQMLSTSAIMKIHLGNVKINV